MFESSFQAVTVRSRSDIAFDDLPECFAGDADPDDAFPWWAPFWSTVTYGLVTAIEEQYLPALDEGGDR